MIGFGKPLFRFNVLVMCPHFYRQIYRHFDRDPFALPSQSIGIYREQSGLSQWTAFETYRDLSTATALRQGVHEPIYWLN